MIRTLFVVILSLLSMLSYALNVECVGNAALIDNNGDTLLLFENAPELKSKVGDINWYRLPDTINTVSSGTDYLYPEHGEGYAIKVDGKWEMFWVFDYEQLVPQINDVEVIQSCKETQLNIDGVIPQMQYKNQHNQLQNYARLCRVTYMDAMWSENDWVDSTAVIEKEFRSTIVVDATPVATEYVITDLLAEALQIGDSIITPIYQPMAVKAHPQAIVTTRGKEGDRSNEVERPIDSETLVSRSAPLDVEFKANGLNTEYYQWNLYRGQELLLRRSEAQHRYTFEEPGAYRMVMIASNSHGCAIDSVEFAISVSVSMIEVPNVFTPNGDGTNDEFRVVYRSIKEFHCWIYNRWGRLVYKWDDPAKGWDGTINGRPAAQGAYYYVIRALGTDAEEGYRSKPAYTKALKKQELPVGVYQLSGDINLLR